MKNVFKIEQETVRNNVYRNVVFTGKHLQLVYMSLNPGEIIPNETHRNTDQFFRVEAGVGRFVMDESASVLKNGDAIIVPAGTSHSVENVGNVDLKLYTIYAPPQHEHGKCQIRQPPEE